MARSLASKTNVNAPNGTYPYGQIRDNPGDGTGTPVNEAVYGDFHQFFERLLALGSVAANNLPENNTNGFQYGTALGNYIQTFINTLKGGVPVAGDTLNKLYNLITAVGRPRGGYNASGGVVPGSASNEAGDFWRITVAGTIPGLLSGSTALKPGDLLIADVDGATAANQFYSIQSNVDQADASTLGLVKLYSTIGTNTDGPVTQAYLKTIYDGLLISVDNRVLKAGDIMTGTLSIPNGTLPEHAVNKSQLDGIVASKVDKGGDTMTGPLAMSGNKITGLGAATANGDAIRYEQVFSRVYEATGNTNSGGTPETFLTIPVATGQNIQIDATLVSKFVSGAGVAGDGSNIRKMVAYRNVAGTISLIAAEANLVSQASVSGAPNLVFTISGTNILVRGQAGSGDVYSCRARAEVNVV